MVPGLGDPLAHRLSWSSVRPGRRAFFRDGIGSTSGPGVAVLKAIANQLAGNGTHVGLPRCHLRTQCDTFKLEKSLQLIRESVGRRNGELVPDDHGDDRRARAERSPVRGAPNHQGSPAADGRIDRSQ